MVHDPRCKAPSLEVLLHGAREAIREYGWCDLGVLASAAGGPGYVYTTGLLETYSHPELVVSGLPPELAHDILSAAVEAIHGGSPVTDGQRRELIIEGGAVLFRGLTAEECAAGFGLSWRYYGAPPPRFQMYWPDVHGRFPNDPECDPGTAAAQILPLPGKPPTTTEG
jgi:Domain of unknown function (DUF4262)